MTCVISRNFAQPIPHHANPNSIVVAELQLNGLKAHTFAVGQKMFPESFSSWLLSVAQQLLSFPVLVRRIIIFGSLISIHIRILKDHQCWGGLGTNLANLAFLNRK